MKVLDAAASSIDLYEKAYLNLIADQNNSQFQKEFFLHFPKDFATLDSYYGHENLPNGKCRYMPMYTKYGIDAYDIFFKLNTVQKECIYEKSINILQGGFDDYDTVGLFMVATKEAIQTDRDDFLLILSKRLNKEQYGFLYSLFSGYEGAPRDIDLEKTLADLTTLKKQYPVLYSNLRKAIKNSKMLALEHPH
jgi:hypothetical protein